MRETHQLMRLETSNVRINVQMECTIGKATLVRPRRSEGPCCHLVFFSGFHPPFATMLAHTGSFICVGSFTLVAQNYHMRIVSIVSIVRT